MRGIEVTHRNRRKRITFLWKGKLAKRRRMTDMDIKIINQEADYENTLSILKENKLRPLTYQEALVSIDKDLELKNKLKGKWFYLQGKGLDKEGYHTFNNKGNLKEGKGNMEETIYLWSGKNPLSFGVRSDYGALINGRRFGLSASNSPDSVAGVVVGVQAKPKDKKLAAKAKKLKSKIEKLQKELGAIYA